MNVVSDSSRLHIIDEEKNVCDWLTIIIKLKLWEIGKDMRIGDCIN